MEENKQQSDSGPEAAESVDPSDISVNRPSGDGVQPTGERRSFPKKKPIIIGLIILVLLGGGVGAFLLRQDQQDQAAVPTQQTVAKIGVIPALVDGTATYKQGEADWQPLTTETNLGEGALVSTDAGSRAVLVFDDGSALRLDESTSIELVSLVADDIRINQASGTAYSRVVTSDRTYQVQVGDTSYTALGTAFTTINKLSEKGVQVLQSSVKVDNQDTAVAEGKQYFTEHSDSGVKDKQTDINLETLKDSSFMLWNLAQDEQSDIFKDKLGVWEKVKQQTETPPTADEPVASPGAVLKLTASNNSKGTVLAWTVSGVDVSDGFKVVRSKKSSTPTFGKDEAAYISKPSARSYTWKSDSEGTFWYRVCAYRPDQGTCSNYSNAVKMQAVYVAPEKVVRGSITLQPADQDNILSWSMMGTAPYGYKVVVSSSPNPTYPENSVDLTGKTSYQLKPTHLSAGTNYVRICKYTSGSEADKCVDYSNEITIIK